MKKFITAALVILLLSAFVPPLSAQKQNYTVPRTQTVPIIDGKGTDNAWQGAKVTVKLQKTSCLQNGGYVLNLNSTEADDAYGTVDVLWSDAKGKEGLYLKWEVVDYTQSYAVDPDKDPLDAMDSVQIVLDPLYKQSPTIQNTALCFTFVPYAAKDGSGIVIQEKAYWEESWGQSESSRKIQAVSSCNKAVDPTTNRQMVQGYTIEAYIPTQILSIGGYEPSLKVGAKIGIGFALIDYQFDFHTYDPKNPENSVQLANIIADFGDGADGFNTPSKYNLLVLADENGNTQGQEDEPNDPPVSENTGEILFELRKSIVTAQNILNNENTASYYTEKSLTALESALKQAEKVSISNSKTEITNAKKALDNAYAALETKESLKDLLSRADTLVQEDYTQDSWENFVRAKTTAKNITGDENSEEGRVAKITLIEAIANLQPATSSSPEEAKQTLTNLVSEMQKLIASDYTEESWNRFKRALTAAEDLLLNQDSAPTTGQLDAATKTLTDARNALVKTPKSSLWIPITIIIVCIVIAGAGITVLFIVKKKDSAKYYKQDTTQKDQKPKSERLQSFLNSDTDEFEEFEEESASDFLTDDHSSPDSDQTDIKS